MGEQRERLFRDESGAAVERAARLEDENRALRAEVERLRLSAGEAEPPGPERQRPNERALAGLAGGMLALFVGAAAMVARPHGGCPSARSASTMRLSPGVAVAPLQVQEPTPVIVTSAPSLPRANANAKENCSPPYTVAPDGRRHYKLACL